MSKNGLSFLMGLAAGVAIGLLVAPRAGAQTREQITGRMRRDMADDVTSSASDYATESRRGVAAWESRWKRIPEHASLPGDPGSEGY
jgi:gas vesicle protein